MQLTPVIVLFCVTYQHNPNQNDPFRFIGLVNFGKRRSFICGCFYFHLLDIQMLARLTLFHPSCVNKVFLYSQRTFINTQRFNITLIPRNHTFGLDYFSLLSLLKSNKKIIVL